jgi:hypothetical protein
MDLVNSLSSNTTCQVNNVRGCVFTGPLTIGAPWLTFYNLEVTLHTTRFNTKKFYVVPTLRLCVLYRSQNKQQLLPYETLRDWFL